MKLEKQISSLFNFVGPRAKDTLCTLSFAPVACSALPHVTCIIMEPRLSLESLSFAVPGRAEEKPEEKRSPFEASIRDKLEFWAENVPSKDDYSFQSLIQSELKEISFPIRR